MDCRWPRGNCARPKSPERICGLDGNSILTVKLRLEGSAAGTICTTLPEIGWSPSASITTGTVAAQVDRGHLAFIDLNFQAKVARILDDQQRDTRCRHGAGVNELGRYQPIEGSANAGESDDGISLGDCGFGLCATGMSGVATCLGGCQFRLHLVEFLRADRLLVVQHLVALHGRLGQRVIGIGGRNALVGSLHPGGGTLVGGTRLGRVDRDQHFPAADVIAFVHVDAGDRSHHLAGELRGIRRANRAGCFHVVGNGGALRGEDRNARDGLGSRRSCRLLAGARAEESDE